MRPGALNKSSLSIGRFEGSDHLSECYAYLSCSWVVHLLVHADVQVVAALVGQEETDGDAVPRAALSVSGENAQFISIQIITHRFKHQASIFYMNGKQNKCINH